MLYKTCITCKQDVDVLLFHKAYRNQDGLSQHCKSCAKEYYKKRYSKNRQHILNAAKKWASENQDRRRTISSEWAKRNKARVTANKQRWNDRNPGRLNQLSKKWREANSDHVKELTRLWAINNRHKRNFTEASRSAVKTHATPDWLTSSQKEEMVKIYKSCPDGYHVDHIVPLKGKSVCGLHVPWNLQYLPAIENIRKGNRI